jgi:hypothetical protein
VVGLVWALGGFTPTFGDDAFLGLIGGVDALGRHWNVAQLVGFASADPAVPWPGPDAIPVLAFAMFQLMFAIITPALISGAIVERAKFWFWAVFVALWSVLVYAPVGHWVFSFDGFLGTDSTGGRIANQLKAVDFAGRTVVHINAGAAALALAIVLGRRRGWPNAVARPHNLPFVLLGASLLWFGWYGFNAGSALAANGLAALAFANTTVATCAAVLAWLIVEQLRTGRPTTLGAASGAARRDRLPAGHRLRPRRGHRAAAAGRRADGRAGAGGRAAPGTDPAAPSPVRAARAAAPVDRQRRTGAGPRQTRTPRPRGARRAGGRGRRRAGQGGGSATPGPSPPRG